MNIVKNNCLKITLSFLLIFCFSFKTFSQEISDKTPNQFWKNVSFGGAVGLNFGNGFFSGTLAPSAVYNFSNSVSAGLGLNATYNKEKNVFSSTILGGSIIGLFNPIREIQLSTEFEQLHVNRKFEEGFSSVGKDNFWATALFLGVGYRSGPVTFGIRYDVLYDEDDSIYSDPWLPFVRVFF